MNAPETLAYWTNIDVGWSREDTIRRLTPGAIADNTGRIYDWMDEQGLPPESTTREALFAYAAEAFGVDYDVFYDAWLEERPANVRKEVTTT